jgi:hypothetical protein
MTFNALFGSFECVLAIVVQVIDIYIWLSEKTYLQCKYMFLHLHLPYVLGESFFYNLCLHRGSV